MIKIRSYTIILLLGILFIIISLLLEGQGLFFHTLEHVYSDLTVELTVHVFLLGILLILYAGYKTRS